MILNAVGLLGININVLDEDLYDIKSTTRNTVTFGNFLFLFDNNISWKKSNKYFVICDSSIYNKTELLNELKNRGYKITEDNNAELILNLYKEFGIEFLNKLDGDFVICVIDSNKNTVYLARDRMGIKPFYYHTMNEFVFSTNIKNILDIGIKAEPNDRMIFDYLFYNLKNHTHETFFKDIYQIPPANFLMFKKGTMKLTEYWKMNISSSNRNADLTYESLKNTFFNAAQKRMGSEKFTAVSLSGGLDSSSLVATFCKICPNNALHTYSCVFRGYNDEDSACIEKMAQNYPIVNKGIIINSNELENDFNKFIYCLEEPALFDWEYMKYKLMEIASKDNMKILFDGNCADGVFLGSEYHYGIYFAELLKELKIYKLITLLKKSKNSGFSINPIFITLFLLAPAFIKSRIYERKFMKGIEKEFYKNFEKKWEAVGYTSENDLVLNIINFNRSHVQCMLSGFSKYARMFSINVRLPYSDINLQKSILSIPSDEQFKNCSKKYLLQKIMKEILIDDIRTRRKKIGTDFPLNNWFRNELRDFVWDIINSETFARRKYFDAKVTKSKFEEHVEGKINFCSQLWKVINLELWLRTFIDSSGCKDENISKLKIVAK